MYKIIGANQIEYGPVSAEQVRQWIAEGRINAQTHAQAVGDTNWKPISAFPEFAADFPTNATPPPMSSSPPLPPPPPSFGNRVPTDAGRAGAQSEVSGPAIGLMVTALLGAFWALAGIGMSVFSVPMNFGNLQNMPPEAAPMFKMMQAGGGGLQVFLGVVHIALAAVIFMGALRMKALQSHTFAIIASVVALVPCVSPCCCIGLPLGIWALVVLNKTEVRDYFS